MVVAGDMDKPTSIVVDPAIGLLFWADRGRSPKIERARLNGADRRSLVIESVFIVTGLSLDFEQQRLYWCDSRLDAIESIAYDGTDRRLLLDKKHLQNPFGLAVYMDTVYWIDTSLTGGTLFAADKNNATNYAAIRTELGESLKDIKVHHFKILFKIFIK